MFIHFTCRVWLAAAFILCYFPSAARAVDLSRPDSHAPLGVMGDHTHHKGEVMFSYRYMHMDMQGNRDGTSNRSSAEVLQGFPITPTKMSMAMHMLGGMYAPADDVTLTLMVPWVQLHMDHLNRMGVHFSTGSQGLGDIKFAALKVLSRSEFDQLHLNLGISIPTGSINKRDRTPLGRVRLPYPMQLGSGTLDLMPGLTYVRQLGDWSFGSQAIATLHLFENSKDYRLGDRLQLSLWISRVLVQSLSASLRLEGQSWGNISGSDAVLTPGMVPTADPDRRGGRRLDAGFGLNWTFQQGPLKGHRLAAEVLVPVYQWLDGPQLETDWTTILGWQRAF